MDISEMRAKRIVIAEHVPNAVTLNDALEKLRPYGGLSIEEAYRRGAIKRNQARAILVHAADSLPCFVTVRQRTPFGVAYVTLPDKSFDIDKAGKLLGSY